MNIVIIMPELGFTTGEMPHVRFPPKNYMPGQNLYYLYTACRNLGHHTRVVDANWTIDPLARTLDFKPDKVLITTATPTFSGTLKIIGQLREAGYSNELYVGGPHVSLNFDKRRFMLSAVEGVTLIPMVDSLSTFDWVPTVFPGRKPFEVMGMPDEEAQALVAERFTMEFGRSVKQNSMERYLFTYFRPSIEWMADTYTGPHIKDSWRDIEIRYSIITSIGCSKTCSFCANPYVYRIGFKSPEVVREIVQELLDANITRISVHDMYFVMSEGHARKMMEIFGELGMQYSMQTCLENLTDGLLDELKATGMQKFLVGIENPLSYTVGKSVDLDKVSWLLRAVKDKGLEGVKLSYIVGLPGVAIDNDFFLLRHIVDEVTSNGHPLFDLQVNLYTPYRPEPDTTYVPYGVRGLHIMREKTIYILTEIPFKFWGSYPVGFAQVHELRQQMMLCDVTFAQVYSPFVEKYMERRALYMEELSRSYPELARNMPTFAESCQYYAAAAERHQHAASAPTKTARPAALAEEHR